MRPISVLNASIHPLWIVAILTWLLLTYAFVHFAGWERPVAKLLANDRRVETLMPDAQLLIGSPFSADSEIVISFESGFDTTTRSWNTVVKPRHARLLTSDEHLMRDLPGPLMDPQFIDIDNDGKSEVVCRTLIDHLEPGVLVFRWPTLERVGSFILHARDYMPDSLTVPWNPGIAVGPFLPGNGEHPAMLLLKAGCGHALAPRGIIAIDPLGLQREFWHRWTASSVDQVQLLETNLGNELRIFFSTYPPANGAVVDSLNDRTAYLGMLRRDGTLQWLRSWNYPFTSLTFFPQEAPVTTLVVARTSLWEPAGPNRIYRLSAMDGSLQDSVMLEDRSDRNFFAPLAETGKGAARFLVLEGGFGYANISGGLEKSRDKQSAYALHRTVDVEHDGQFEYEARDALNNSVIVNADFQPLIEFSMRCDQILFQHADTATVCWYHNENAWYRAWVISNARYRWAFFISVLQWVWLAATLLMMGSMLYRVNRSNLHERALLKFMRHSIIERLEEFIEPVRRQLADSTVAPTASQPLAEALARYRLRAEKIKNTTAAVRLYLRDDDFSLEPLSLRTLLQSVQSQWTNESLRRIEVVCNTDIDISGNKIALMEVFAQLIENSDRFFRSLPYSIVLTVVPGGDQVTVRYSDNGKGIAPHVRRRIFKLGVSTKGEEGASKLSGGFGLYYVREVILSHRGSIRLGKPSSGAEFIMTFPVYQSSGAFYA